MKIRQKREVNVIVLCVSLMTPRPIHRNTEDLGAIFLKLRADLVVERDLVAANRAPIGRVEGEYHPATSQFAERQILIRRNAQ
jgi:hypothetical protein